MNMMEDDLIRKPAVFISHRLGFRSLASRRMEFENIVADVTIEILNATSVLHDWEIDLTMWVAICVGDALEECVKYNYINAYLRKPFVTRLSGRFISELIDFLDAQDYKKHTAVAA